MNELAKIQADFQGYVMRDQPGIETAVVGDEIAPAARRLQVYYDAYRLRLQDVLRNDFSGLAALLTAAEWQALCAEYLAAHPSTQTSVRWLGKNLGNFLRATRPWSEQPYLAEMAAFEWAWGRAFDGADSSSLPARELAAVAPETWGDMSLALHPSLQRLDLHWNVPAVFSAHTHAQVLPAWFSQEQSRPWLLWRQNLTVYWRSLDAAEAHALQSAMRSHNMASLCEGLCAWYPADKVPAQAVQFLQRWFTDGLVTSIHVSGN